MGREIRQVPPGWEHPKAQQPWGFDFQPMFDKSYEEARASWEHERDNYTRTDCTFEEWHGEAPDPAFYRPVWTDEERTAWQIYETVSEGTPVSPVFTDKEAMVDWIIVEWGRSRQAAQAFVDAGHAPSMVIVDGRMSDLNAGAWEPEFFGKDKE